MDNLKIIEDYYTNFYLKVHNQLRNPSKFDYHTKLERKLDSKTEFPVVLELGALDLSHLQFVKHK